MTSRSLPQDPQAEASVIATCAGPGAFTLPGVADALTRLSPEHFLVPKHRALWSALKAIWHDGGEADALVLKARLEAEGTLGTAEGFTGIVDTLASPEVGRPQVLADLLLDRWRRRQWLKLAGALANQAGDLTQDEPSLAIEASQAIGRIQSGQATRRTSGLAILERLARQEPFAQGGAEGVAPRIAFNLPAFDDVLERAPGQIILVAARPGVGKTALMIQGFGQTLQLGQKSLFVSLELSRDELEARVASWLTHAPSWRFRKGLYRDREIMNAHEETEALCRASLAVFPSGTPWHTVEAEIRSAVAQEGVSSVWLDYFTLLKRPERKGATDAALWGELSTQIRSLAQQLGIVIVLASQLNRSSKEYEEPDITDLRETGQLEQDAHGIIMLWKGKEGAEEFPYCKLAKNRAGAKVSKTRLVCDYATNRWSVDVRETAPERRAGRNL